LNRHKSPNTNGSKNNFTNSIKHNLDQVDFGKQRTKTIQAKSYKRQPYEGSGAINIMLGGSSQHGVHTNAARQSSVTRSKQADPDRHFHK